jgi:hypothetical protein
MPFRRRIGALFGSVAGLLGLCALASMGFSLSDIFFGGKGSWRALAKRYATDQRPEGQAYSWQTVQIGAVRYRNCTTVIPAPEGLYLAVSTLPGHPALLLPWKELRHDGEAFLYWRNAPRLRVGDPEVATMIVLPGLFEHLRPYLSE